MCGGRDIVSSKGGAEYASGKVAGVYGTVDGSVVSSKRSTNYVGYKSVTELPGCYVANMADMYDG